MLPTEVIPNEAFTSIVQIFDAYIQGESKASYLRVCSKTQLKIPYFLSMPILSTIVQKGGDCKSKSFAPMSFGYCWTKQSRN